MIHVTGRGDQPDPREVVFRGVVETPLRVPALLARFAAGVALLYVVLFAIPPLGQLLLDPTRGGTVSLDPGHLGLLRQVAIGLPVALLALCALAAATQERYAFRGRKVAFRKQGWALYTEFMRQIEEHFEDGEAPRGYRVANPPELATSLLLRLGICALYIALALVAVTTALALRIHWPSQGQLAWYVLATLLSLMGLIILATVRTPPLLRLLLQGAVPALHLGHGLMLWTAPVAPGGLPALLPDLVLGVLGGYAAYVLGQRERGARLYVVTDRGLYSFDASGRNTVLLGARRPVTGVRLRRTPSGFSADFEGEEGPDREFRAVAFEGAEPVHEMATALGVEEVEELPSRPRWLASLPEPGVGGWAVLGVLAVVLGLATHHLLLSQTLLEAHLLRHVPSWFAGDPRPLAAGAREALALSPGFHPAEVFLALASFDAGELEAAGKALADLPPDAELRGFAARVVPAYRASARAVLGRPAADPLARAEALIDHVPGPHAARVALGLLEELAPQPRSTPRARFVEGIACLRLAGRPEAAYTLPGADAASLDRRARAAAGRLPRDDPRAAFLHAWSHLRREEDVAAVETALPYPGIAGLAGAEGTRLVRALAARLVDLVLRDPARWRDRGRDFLAAARDASPEEARVGLAFARAALADPGEAAREAAALGERHPDADELFRVLAEEVAGNHSRAEFFAYHLVGLDAARGQDPARIPALAPLAPPHRYYVAALALRGLGEAERAAALLAGAPGGPPGWPGLARGRDLGATTGRGSE